MDRAIEQGLEPASEHSGNTAPFIEIELNAFRICSIINSSLRRLFGERCCVSPGIHNIRSPLYSCVQSLGTLTLCKANGGGQKRATEVTVRCGPQKKQRF